MAISGQCPGCKASLKLADSFNHKKVKCIKCGKDFVINGAAKSDPSNKVGSGSSIKVGSSSSIDLAITMPGRNLTQPALYNTLPKEEKKSAGGIIFVLMAGMAFLFFCLILPIGGMGVGWFFYQGETQTASNDTKTPLANIPEDDPVKTKDPPTKTKADDPPPVRLGPDTVTADRLSLIKSATVAIKSESPMASKAGTGFLIQADKETGYIVANYYVTAPQVKDVKIPVTTPPPAVKPKPGVVAPPRLPVLGPRFITQRTVVYPNVTVIFGAGTPKEFTAQAKVVAEDKDSDLVFLKCTGVKNLPKPLDTTQKALPAVNMPVTIYGFPFGKEMGKGHPPVLSATGKIAGVRKDEIGDVAAIQITGGLNLGTSGGPVIDAGGRLVGVAVAKDNNNGLAIATAELDKFLAGRPASAKIARRLLAKDFLVTHDGEAWTFDRNRNIPTAFIRPAIEPAGMEFQTKPLDESNADVWIEATLFDPMGRITMASIHYLKSDLLRQPPKADASGNWPALPSSKKVDLKLASPLASVSLKIPVINKNDEYYFQFSFRNKQGQSSFTQPRSFRIDRSPVLVVKNPNDPKNPPIDPKNPPKEPPSDIKPIPRVKLTEEQVAQIMEDLKADDIVKKIGAMDQLFGAEPIAKHLPEISRLLEPMLDPMLEPKDTNVHLRRRAVRTLGIWGDAKSVRHLQERMGAGEMDIFTRQFALEAAGALKVSAFAEPVAACLTDFLLRHHASAALKKMGSAAEPAVVKMLESMDPAVRAEAIAILKVIGTKVSVPALQNVAKDPNPGIASAATDALTLVAKR